MTGRPPDSVIVEPTALIGGRAALILSTILSGGLRNVPPLHRLVVDMKLDPASAAEAMDALRALDEAGQALVRSRFPQAGNAATRGNAPALASDAMIIDASGAALLLSVSARRVRQLAAAGDLPGVKLARGWRFARDEVVGYRERILEP